MGSAIVFDTTWTHLEGGKPMATSTGKGLSVNVGTNGLSCFVNVESQMRITRSSPPEATISPFSDRARQLTLLEKSLRRLILSFPVGTSHKRIVWSRPQEVKV